MKPMGSNPKESRLEKEQIDRISSLPDSILSKILSCLPTKNAVGASILSTRWKNISPFGVLPITIDLSDSLLLRPTENVSDSPSATFLNFADRLFNETLSDVPCLDKMILNCEKKNYGDAKIVSWVSSAIRLKVECLSLTLTLDDSYTLFCCLKGCTTLVALRLWMESELFVPEGFCLPNLKTLQLHRVTFNDEEGDSINELIEGCPVLEDLSLIDCNMRFLQFLFIRAPLLKKLKIECCWAKSACELVLTTPNLESLFFNDYAAGSYSLGKFKTLSAAEITVSPNEQLYDGIFDFDDEERLQFYDEVAELVSACSNSIELYLAECTIDALHHSSVPLPVFQRLTILILGCLGVHWELLAHLLMNAPCLEILALDEGFEKNEEGFANFQKSLPVPPVCLDMHLKRIELCVFKEDEDEIKLIEYFLKNGKVLEKLVLRCVPFEDLTLFLRIEMMPKLSKLCHIVYEYK